MRNEYIKALKDIKNTVSEFQSETKSNSVLDYCVWLENKLIRIEALEIAEKESRMNRKRYEEQNGRI